MGAPIPECPGNVGNVGPGVSGWGHTSMGEAKGEGGRRLTRKSQGKVTKRRDRKGARSWKRGRRAGPPGGEPPVGGCRLISRLSTGGHPSQGTLTGYPRVVARLPFSGLASRAFRNDLRGEGSTLRQPKKRLSAGTPPPIDH